MKEWIFKLFVLLFYGGMIFFNFLANSLPLNNRNTGQISDDYPALFTPSGFSFSIWGIIYVLLGIVVVKIILSSNDTFFENYSMLFIILFLITSITNIAWLFCWHYDKILLSTIIMVVFLVGLSIITFYLKDLDYLTKVAFSIYTGWVSIALIANITILLVKANIPMFQNNETLWYVIIMIVGVVLGLLILILSRNVFYIMVFVWAYFGIFMKHFNQTGYHLTKNLNTFNGLLLVVLILGMSIIFYLNEFAFYKPIV
ncbi:MAG: tryptophan-rich sensory protein [Tenericutes bacterium]|nr:tryptophan-rich sensory protein [Mycoplasmatota bacterium]